MPRIAHDVVDAADQPGLDQVRIGAGKSGIGEDVARLHGGAGGFHGVSLHDACHGCAARRRTRSNSRFGVAMPRLAFFRKACRTWTAVSNRTVQAALKVLPSWRATTPGLPGRGPSTAWRRGAGVRAGRGRPQTPCGPAPGRGGVSDPPCSNPSIRLASACHRRLRTMAGQRGAAQGADEAPRQSARSATGDDVFPHAGLPGAEPFQDGLLSVPRTRLHPDRAAQGAQRATRAGTDRPRVRYIITPGVREHPCGSWPLVWYNVFPLWHSGGFGGAPFGRFAKLRRQHPASRDVRTVAVAPDRRAIRCDLRRASRHDRRKRNSHGGMDARERLDRDTLGADIDGCMPAQPGSLW